MATKKISELSTTTTPSSSALFPIVDSSDNFAVTLTNIAANMPDVTATSLTSSSTITASSGFVGNLTGNVTGNLTGTASAATLAASATALATGRTIALTGDVTYTSGSFDGTGNVTGTASIGSGVIVNDDVNASAAIAFSKMANLTASRALVSDGSGDVSVSAVTSTEVGYLDGVSSGIQTQLDGKASSSYVPTTITIADESTDTTCFPLFVTAATGDLGPKTASGLTFNSNTDVLSGTFSGGLTGNVTGNTSGSSGSCTGNAATATVLETARDIGGVSFNGSASIDLPGVNSAGNQNTSGTAAGLSSTLAVGSGGTGATSLTANGALIGNGTGAVTAVDMSTKGHLLAGDGSGNPSALAVGTNTHVLTADSSEATGLKWAAASGGTPTDITVADESSDTTCFPLFVTAATGDLGPKTGSNLAFNSSSGLLTATSFEGALDLNGAELVLDADADTSIHANTDDQIDIKVGNTDVAHIVNTGVSQGALLNRNPTPIVINGDMRIAQRGDQTGITSFQYINIDRFFVNMINLGTWSFTQSTSTPDGLGFASSLKIDCTTADASPAAADNFYLSMQSEGQNLQIMEKGTSSARTSTIAYWIKSNKTGNYVVELWDRTNDRHVGKVVTISSANTWEKHVCNFPADTSGALANTNARSIMLSWAFDSGSNFTSGTLPSAWQARVDANRFVGTNLGLGDNTANEVLITGVQWEMGTFTSATMPPFQHEDAGTSLARCQRYFQIQATGTSGSGYANGSFRTNNNAQITHHFKTDMRANPTCTQIAGSNMLVHDTADGDNITVTSVDGILANSNGGVIIAYNLSGTSASAGDGCWLYNTGSTPGIKFEAEL